MPKFSRVLWAALVVVCTSTVAEAAPIVWSAPTTISGDTDVVTTGTLDRAFNFDHSGTVMPVTINGVLFASFGVLSSSPVTVGTTTLSSSGGTLNGTNGVGSASAPFSNLSANYRTMLASCAFASPTGSTLTLTLGGLSIGQNYQFQFWVNDSRATIGADREETATTAPSSVTAVQFNTLGTEGGVGQYVLGTFVADSTSETIVFSGQTTGNTPAVAQINGMQLRLIPEPSATALLFVGGMMSILSLRRLGYRSNRDR